MYLQQHQQEAQQQQWIQDQQQQNQQLHAQHLQQMQMQQQNLNQDNTLGHQLTRKRGFANESDEFMTIKKRNMGSEASAQGMFGFASGPDSPGSIMSAMDQEASQGGYFDQQPYYSGSSSAAVSPRVQGSSHPNGASAPSTPSGLRPQSTASSSMPSNLSNHWNQGSHSSPPTPQITALTTSAAASNMYASCLAGQQPLEYRLLQEQARLQGTQQHEQQNLQMTQHLELQKMQRQQGEQAGAQQQAMAIAAAEQRMQQQSAAHLQSTIHHDHNDPATWGYDHANTAGQFTGYLGGQGKGYTPASIGGVAALAAASAMATSRHPQGAGRGAGSAGMDMDL
ncbi:hypothetical protein BG011_000107 [Mortierella polycephala]|uniref:Uncharacterized protein n=1 Tax=Mortierella polycephala TaxID=41804 RepID=A0A9P6PLL5_9FUNG|nr:hypothetical protein BG011_000107 [Mortierella polycephala]